MKIILAQTNIVWEDWNANVKNMEKVIIAAQNQDADIIAFPELTLSGFSMRVNRLAKYTAASKDLYSTLAVKYNIAIAGGYIDCDSEGYGRNCYSVHAADGTQVLDYQKIHPFSFGGENKYYRGGATIDVATVCGIETATFICYDLRFPEIFQIASRTAELIIVAANWPGIRASHWRTLLQARAIENQCYIAGVNRCGSDYNVSYSGGSMIIAPDCTILSEAADGEQTICAEIQPVAVQDLRRRFPLKSDRCEELYHSYYLGK